MSAGYAFPHVDNLFGTIRMHKTKESIDVVAVNWVLFTNAV